ncbi:MAG: hypothetical protein V7641_718 [Blastocatellia bacterium]
MLRQATSQIVAVRFTPSGGIISASKDGTVTMWNRDSDHPLWSVSFKRPPRMNDATLVKINAMDLSLDGRTVAVAYIHSGVDLNLIDKKAGDPMKQIASVWQPHIVLIDTADGTIKKDIQEIRDKNTIREVILSPIGKSVFVTTAAIFVRAKNHPPSTTHVLSMDTGHEVRAFNSPDWVMRAALSPDGRLFAAAVYQHTEGDTAFYELQFYDADTGQLLRSSKFETTQTVAIGFSPDGRLLAISRSTKAGIRVDLFPTDDAGKPTRTITVGQVVEIRAVAFIQEQQRLALAGGRLPIVDFNDTGSPMYKDKGGTVIVVDEKTGKKLTSHKFQSFVTCLAISPDGSRMAAGMYDGQIAIAPP